MADHSDRSHSNWAASATARNWHCSGALVLSRYAPPQKESIHSARGTACHQIAEKCLRTGVDASSFLETVEKTKSHDIEIDEELVNSAQEYVDYVRENAAYTPFSLALDKGRAFIEQRFDLSALGTPFDAGGTGDAILINRGSMEIIDLKNGMGVVDVAENMQLRTYALGAMLANPGLDVEKITVTIVQPRAPHKDGRIRSETFHVADLGERTAALLAAMRRSKQAMDDFEAVGGNTVILDEWNAKWLKPGKCTFCPVEGSCPALKRDALSVAKVWFDDMGDARLGNEALDTSPEALARDLDMIPMLEGWIDARRALAHSVAEQGVDLPTSDGEAYILVDKIGHRKWNAEVTAAEIQTATGLPEEKVYAPPKLASPSALEKITGAKGKPKIKDLWHAPVTGKNLVRSDKTSRPPAKTIAAKYFET